MSVFDFSKASLKELEERYNNRENAERAYKFVDAFYEYYEETQITKRKERIFILCRELIGYGIERDNKEAIEKLRKDYSVHWLLSRRILLDYIHECFDIIDNLEGLNHDS